MELKDILEAILFSSQKPLSAKELQDILKQAGEAGEGESKEFSKTKAAAITKALETLAVEVDELNRSHRLVGGILLASRRSASTYLATARRRSAVHRPSAVQWWPRTPVVLDAAQRLITIGSRWPPASLKRDSCPSRGGQQSGWVLLSLSDYYEILPAPLPNLATWVVRTARL